LKLIPLGGVNEIGGNKFYIEAGGEGLLIDFGVSFASKHEYFGGYLRPKKYAVLASLLKCGAVPAVSNIYDESLFDPLGVVEESLKSSLSLNVLGAIISHPHVDHYGHLSLKIAQTRERTKSSRTVEERIFLDRERVINTFRTGSKVNVGSIEVLPIHVDHSVPGSYGFIIHTSEGGIAYSGDLRLHGPKSQFTREFVETIQREGIEVLMLEGTRIDEEEDTTEHDVYLRLSEIFQRVRHGLVVVLTGVTDYDRFISITRAARENSRITAVSLRMAAMLEVFHELGMLPKELLPGAGNVVAYVERKGSGSVDLEKDYERWERNYVYQLRDKGSEPVFDVDLSREQSRYVMVINAPDDVLELAFVRPMDGSVFVFSSSEPHNEEQEIDRQRVENWLRVLGMRSLQVHASGHASRAELIEILREASPKMLIPIHSEKPSAFNGLVKEAQVECKIIEAPRLSELRL
jgi:ribonuclease J